MRDPLAQGFRQREAGQLTVQLDGSGDHVDHAFDHQPVEHVSSGRPLKREPAHAVSGRLDVQLHVAQDRRTAAGTITDFRQDRRRFGRGDDGDVASPGSRADPEMEMIAGTRSIGRNGGAGRER